MFASCRKRPPWRCLGVVRGRCGVVRPAKVRAGLSGIAGPRHLQQARARVADVQHAGDLVVDRADEICGVHAIAAIVDCHRVTLSRTGIRAEADDMRYAAVPDPGESRMTQRSPGGAGGRRWTFLHPIPQMRKRCGFCGVFVNRLCAFTAMDVEVLVSPEFRGAGGCDIRRGRPRRYRRSGSSRGASFARIAVRSGAGGRGRPRGRRGAAADDGGDVSSCAHVDQPRPAPRLSQDLIGAIVGLMGHRAVEPGLARR
jgi:hypothetical protein